MVGQRQRDRRDRHLERHAIGLDAAQHLVEVEPAVQPHGGAGRGRGQQVEQTEDVRRRRGHLEPVVGAEAEGRRTSARVAWPIERCVWRTAFGSPVVPELNTSTASSVSRTSPSAGRSRLADCQPPRGTESSSRSVTWSRPRRSREQRRRLAVGDRVHRCGERDGVVDLDRLPRRAQQHRGRAQLADGEHGDHELGRGSRSSPPPGHGDRRRGRRGGGRRRWRGRRARPKVHRSSPASTASRSPNRSAACSSPRCISAAAIGNILLASESGVNTNGRRCSQRSARLSRRPRPASARGGAP